MIFLFMLNVLIAEIFLKTQITMEISHIDFFIISKIKKAKLKKKEITTWDIAKDYLNVKDDGNNSQELKRKNYRLLKKQNEIIKNHLKKMSDWGLVLITKENNGNKIKNLYILIKENIKVGKHKFPDRYCSNAFCLKIEKKWISFENPLQSKIG